MSTDQTSAPPAPPPPPAPYTPAWALYLYRRRAFLTYNGQLITVATCLTPAREARIEGIFRRLARRTRTDTRSTTP